MKERVKQFIRYEKWKRWFERYERLLIPGALVVGVFVDFVTFRSIKIETAFLILAVYVVLAGLAILILQTKETDRGKLRSYLRLLSPIILQFAFGALLSASLLFYWFSGAFSVSWPVLGIIAILMTSNEVLRHYYQKPVIQFTVFYFILFSLGTLVLPYIFNSIDVSLFVLVGFGSLGLMALFVLFSARFFTSIRRVQMPLTISILSVFALMNGLYFLNVIPPIPLSLRQAGVYHDVRPTAGQYVLQTEKETWLDQFLPGQVVHLETGKGVSIFTAIFAPSKLNTTIVHQWQFYDEIKKEWMQKDRLSFSLSGGRLEGYRGYSKKSVVAPGRWRVRVETERGQVLGRINFQVEHVDQTPELISQIQ